MPKSKKQQKEEDQAIWTPLAKLISSVVLLAGYATLWYVYHPANHVVNTADALAQLNPHGQTVPQVDDRALYWIHDWGWLAVLILLLIFWLPQITRGFSALQNDYL